MFESKPMSGNGVGVDERDLAARKDFLQFRKEDEDALARLHEIAQRYADPVIDDLYRHFLAFEDTRAFFRDPRVLERVKALQKQYFLRLTQGNYDEEYLANRMQIGTVHERIGLAPKWYLGAYNFYLRTVAARLLEAMPNEPRAALTSFLSLMKLVFLDISVAMDTYIHAREATMRKQQEAIRELSTPVLQIRDHLLLLPIIGVIDTQRARLITENLLRAVRSSRARVVVMDVTGVATIDSKVANHLLQTVEAARLMGATVIVSGISSDVAQALVVLGIDLSRLNTVGDLQGGIEEAERLLGLRLVRASGSADTQAVE
ncbi:MAG TPA: protoglobin domain-containing protein [Polyangiaceae bacterium]|nr:protoglobin domain-containing protein [Polyangiaceae bacterium]